MREAICRRDENGGRRNAARWRIASSFTRYAYDANGNRTSRTDANGHITLYTYDVMNRQKTRTLPGGGGAETLSYNLTGTLASILDFNGKTTTLAYDTLDRLVTRTPDASFGEPAVTFTYTATGQRSKMTDASGPTTYSYDNQNRLISKTTTAGTLTYTYDAAGNRLTAVSSNDAGTNVAYSYDELNRLKTAVDNRTAGTTTYSYDVVGNMSRAVLPNGVQITPQLDLMNRVTGLPVTSTPAANYTYTYGLSGNRSSAKDSNGRLASYGYDSIYRLTSENITGDSTNKNGGLGYELDAVGNRLTLSSTVAGINPQTLNYDANDRTLGNTYDANGNTLSSGGKTYRYDSLDRLTSFNNGTVTIVYDGDGNRVAKTSGVVTTQYLVDDTNPTGLAQVVEELPSGVVKRTYTYGLERISETQAGVTSYYGYDAHGDVRTLMDGTGTVTDSYEYDAFGNLVTSTGTTANVFRYQGEALDTETGLYYLRARYYDPVAGRFLSVDPLADEGQHPYTYAGADPVNGHDPTGQQDILEYTLLLQSLTPLSFISYLLPDVDGSLEDQASEATG